MNNNLFIINTPYHITLALTIIKQEKLTNNKLIVVKDFKFIREEYGWIESYFDEIVIINGLYKFNNVKGIKKILTVVKNLFLDINDTKEILKKYCNLKFDNIFFSNDTYVTAQSIILKLKGENTAISYVEDGIACYLDEDHSVKYADVLGKIKLVYNKILISLFRIKNQYENSICYGASSYVKKCYVLYPDYIREELKVKNIIKIDEACFSEVISLNYNENEDKINDSIIFLVDLYNSNLAEGYKMIMDELKKINKKIYLKYHPREGEFYLDSYLSENIVKLDSSKNIEGLLANTKGNVVITGRGSTAFLTLAIVSDNYYFVINKIVDGEILTIIEKILKDKKVKFPKTSRELMESVSKIL